MIGQRTLAICKTGTKIGTLSIPCIYCARLVATHNREKCYRVREPLVYLNFESLNALLKRENTLRERFELSRFFTVAEKDIENRSLDRKPEGPKTVFLEPERTLRLWTESYQFTISSRKSLWLGMSYTYHHQHSKEPSIKIPFTK